MWTWFYKLASPPYAYALAGRLRPWLLGIAVALMIWGTYDALFVVPADYQQKDAARIMYVHVPAAALSLTVYLAMAIAAAVGLIWRMKLAHALAASLAPIGAWYTALALITGAVWGRPMWGTWWAWEDPRIVSETLLLFLYLGYMALRASFDDTQRADRASAVLAIVGSVNVPIVKYSVEWWNSLHQGASILKLDKPSIDSSMLTPMFVMLLAFALFFIAVTCDRLRAEILRRERNPSWLKENSR
ncbi:MAG: heme ABC transporter permease [Candidatus Obscuribacterales bacterium]|nr:heme ABC transporter permease [Steroidobacteraceae bacterium]